MKECGKWWRHTLVLYSVGWSQNAVIVTVACSLQEILRVNIFKIHSENLHSCIQQVREDTVKIMSHPTQLLSSYYENLPSILYSSLQASNNLISPLSGKFGFLGLRQVYNLFALCSMLWRSADTRNISQHTLYSIQHISTSTLRWYIVRFTTTPTQTKTSSHRD